MHVHLVCVRPSGVCTMTHSSASPLSAASCGRGTASTIMATSSRTAHSIWGTACPMTIWCSCYKARSLWCSCYKARSIWCS
jgi:hypothetical protein